MSISCPSHPSPPPDSVFYPWLHDLLQILPFYLNLVIILFPPVVSLGWEWTSTVAFLESMCIHMCMPVYVNSMDACSSASSHFFPGLCFSSWDGSRHPFFPAPWTHRSLGKVWKPQFKRSLFSQASEGWGLWLWRYGAAPHLKASRRTYASRASWLLRVLWFSAFFGLWIFSLSRNTLPASLRFSSPCLFLRLF